MMQCIALLTVLFIVFVPYRAIKIDTHVTDDYNEGLLSLHGNAESFIASMWMIRITRLDNEITDPRMAILKEAITRDRCILLYSGIGINHLLFKIYCNYEAEEDEPVTIDRVLNRTLTDYVYRFYEKSEVSTEQNKPFRRPHFFSGNSHLLEYAFRLGSNKNGNPDEHIMMPSNEAISRSRALNYIAVNVGWDLDRIDQHAGMRDQRYQYITNASDVDVYVIDTGIRVNHVEFEDRANFLINTVGDGIDTDMAGHGTFCASEVAGKSFGVAKKARLFGVKVLDSMGDGDLFTIQAGIIQVIETARLNPHRRAVASLSLGGSSSPMLDSAVASLTANNIVVAVSAGNSGADACLYSPAALGGSPSSAVITVGATDINDFRPTWSNYGQCVSISAPGASITAAWPTSNTATHTLSGTSMAAPLVAGVCALVLQQNSNLSPAEVKEIVLRWATPGVVDYASVTGGGRNLLYSLIDLSVTPPPPQPPSSVILIDVPSDGTSSANTLQTSLLFTLILALLL